ncbi:MAG: AraC family transcriptional regulator [Candidatus Acidiferrales bacterium]|jgi:AraC family transcriptional regulator
MSTSTSNRMRPIYGRAVETVTLPNCVLTETLFPGDLRIPVHSHQCSYLTFVLEGAYQENVGGVREECAPNTFRFLPAGTPHGDRFDSRVRCLNVEFRPELLSKLRNYALPVDAPGQLHGGLAVWLGRRLYREFRDADDLTPATTEAILLELFAENARSRRQAREDRTPTWLRTVRNYLHTSFTNSPKLAEIAAVGGVHPVHLCREFRKHYRMTVGDFIRWLRVEHACKLLAEPGCYLSQVALDCGFADQSHFCATFRKLTGTTPARFRSTCADAPARRSFPQSAWEHAPS